jgi:hypothetical protein
MHIDPLKASVDYLMNSSSAKADRKGERTILHVIREVDWFPDLGTNCFTCQTMWQRRKRAEVWLIKLAKLLMPGLVV